MPLTITFSNPRLVAVIEDYPLGGSKRGRCTFEIEQGKRGYRAKRTTTGKPKFATYAGKAAIVDGSDGRTYVLQHATPYDFIHIMRHDFMDATGTAGQGAVFSKEADTFKTLADLIDAANRPQ